MTTGTSVTRITLLIVCFIACLVACFAGPATGQTYISPTIDEVTFVRYTTPGECARAASWWNKRFWRDKRQDTAYIARGGNPYPRQVVEAAQRCLASINSRFSLSTIPERDLLGLVQAYLASEQDTQADAAATKLTKLVTSRTSSTTVSLHAKAWTLYQLVDVYLDAMEPRLKSAERYLTELDAMGPQAAAARMLGHSRLAAVAQFRDSVPLWDRELKAALKASKELVGDARREYAPESADIYKDIAALKARMNDPQGAIQAIETARSEIVPLRPSTASSLMQSDRDYIRMGQSVSRVEATRWFNTLPNNTANIHPVPGKPSLLVFMYPGCASSICYEGYAVLKRLKAKFEGSGLDITIMTRTMGFWRNELVKPDTEVSLIGERVSKELGLTLPLAVWQTEMGRRDDGRITILSAPNEAALQPQSSTYLPVYLIDPNGNIRFIKSAFRANEAVIEDIIKSMLQ